MASQGANANYSGQKLEAQVEDLFKSLNIEYKKQVKFTDCYGHSNAKMDFMVGNIAIECKRQQGSGTADQKMPFVYENLSMFDRGLVVLDGDHFHARKGIQDYLNSKKSSFFDWCFVEDLESWLEENI